MLLEIIIPFIDELEASNIYDQIDFYFTDWLYKKQMIQRNSYEYKDIGLHFKRWRIY